MDNHSFSHRLIESEDGSHTIYVEELNEHYHSTHGAIQESRHIFIEAGLKTLPTGLQEIRIFEVGFGTGLNAFLTMLWAEENKVPLYYNSIELYPISIHFAAQLNYPQILHPEGQELFLKLHECEWGVPINISKYFTLEKQQIALESVVPQGGFHLIYFDAFAPEKQPLLWTAEIFLSLIHI